MIAQRTEKCILFGAQKVLSAKSRYRCEVARRDNVRLWPKADILIARPMSAFGGKADIEI